jgi:hypothetical protein
MIHNFLFLKGGKVNEQASLGLKRCSPALFLYSWE